MENLKNDVMLDALSKEDCVHVFNLGCARNLVDAQVILGQLKARGNPCVDLDQADVVIINTCSFVEDAKRESIDAILDVIELKKQGKLKKIFVTGCLAARYKKELGAEFNEVDIFGGVLQASEKQVLEQSVLTQQFSRYCKICEGCFNYCSFCIIPKIKGALASRAKEAIIEEVKLYNQQQVCELNIIGQDITAYGVDLYQKKSLADLLVCMIAQAPNIDWFRLLYLYPAHITDELIDCIATNKKICKYIDVPLQHINDEILKRMRRSINKEQTICLIQKLRDRIPGVRLRTTFIVGFPGETKAQFEELCDFVRDMKFDKVGVFLYSHEEGTDAYEMENQVSEKVKQSRFDRLMILQQEISQNLLKEFIGQEIQVLIEEKQEIKEGVFIGRSEFDAPEVDGLVYVHSNKELAPGDFVQVRIIDAIEYDLIGEQI